MAKWIFYVLVFVYMFYKAVNCGRIIDTSISVEQIRYEEEGYLKVGTRKTVNCRAPSKNQRLEWVDPFSNVVKRIPSNRVYSQEHFVSSPRGNRSPGLVLTFTELQVSDSGLYYCKSGDQKKSVRLCVIKPSEFVESDDTPTEVVIEAGRSITLACQAKGDPEPRLVWTRNDEELAEGIEHPKYKVNRRYKIEGYESLLTITDVEPEDSGLYHCLSIQESAMLDNCNNYDSRNVTLQVNFKPQFTRETEYVYGTNNEMVDIKCEAKGWPKPTYKVYKDLGGGALYEFDKSKIVLSDDQNVAVLSVVAGPTTYGNIYKCTATNKFGETDKEFTLLRREKPWKIDHIEPILDSGDHVKLNVSWEETPYFPVDSLSIQYIPASDVDSRIPDRSDWKHADVLDKVIDDDDESDDNDVEESNEGIILKIEELKPETEYFIRVKAINRAGEGPWSETIQITTTSADETEAEEVEDKEEPVHAAASMTSDSGLLYGLVFTGAIVLVGVVCMFIIRVIQ